MGPMPALILSKPNYNNVCTDLLDSLDFMNMRFASCIAQSSRMEAFCRSFKYTVIFMQSDKDKNRNRESCWKPGHHNLKRL